MVRGDSVSRWRRSVTRASGVPASRMRDIDDSRARRHTARSAASHAALPRYECRHNIMPRATSHDAATLPPRYYYYAYDAATLTTLIFIIMR